MATRRRARSSGSKAGADLAPLSAYEEEQSDAISAWKAEEPSVADQAVGFVVKPLTWLVQKVVPEKAMRAALEVANAAGAKLTDVEDVKRDGGVRRIKELRSKDLELSDRLADVVHNWAIGAGVVIGAGGGAAGVLAAPVEIPTLMTLAIRTIHKIGLCYGYEPLAKEDKDFAMGILAAAGASTLTEKYEALVMLRSLEVLIAKQTWKALAERTAERQFSKEAAITTIRGLAKSIGVNLTKRKALAAIPAIGAGVGGSLNGWYIKDVGWAARRSYQERWLIDNHKIIDIEVPDSEDREP
jgi:hypothetical protein